MTEHNKIGFNLMCIRSDLDAWVTTTNAANDVYALTNKVLGGGVQSLLKVLLFRSPHIN